jgi:hypothetical protein
MSVQEPRQGTRFFLHFDAVYVNAASQIRELSERLASDDKDAAKPQTSKEKSVESTYDE